jgi:hypothetical protein
MNTEVKHILLITYLKKSPFQNSNTIKVLKYSYILSILCSVHKSPSLPLY